MKMKRVSSITMSHMPIVKPTHQGEKTNDVKMV